MRKIALVALVLIVLLGFVFKDRLVPLMYYFSKVDNTETIEFYFDKSMDLNELAIELSEKGILNSANAFLSLGAYKKLDRDELALGKYRISPGISIRQLLNGFTKNAAGNGNAEEEVEIVVGNARFVEDLAGKIASKLLLDSAALVMELQNPDRLQEMNLNLKQIHCLFLHMI